jgi:hypothetical protein
MIDKLIKQLEEEADLISSLTSQLEDISEKLLELTYKNIDMRSWIYKIKESVGK